MDARDWPDASWAAALDALSAAWRAGLLSRWLFNGTPARHGTSIVRNGMQSTEGSASVTGDGDICAMDLVHLGSPEVAAWYMRDTAVESGVAPCLVAVDAVGWLASRDRNPPVPLADENSIDHPVLSALGSRTRADVRERLGDSPGWERAFAVTGAVAFDEASVPPAHLVVIRTPSALMSLIGRENAPAPRDLPPGSFQAALLRAAAAQPWMREGWSFSSSRLGTRPVAAEDLSEEEHLAEYGIGRAASLAGPGR